MKILVLSSKRFAGIKLVGHVNNVDKATETQFCATSILLEDGSLFISYRGTDDSLVGWKENFNMSFMSTIPAQLSAAKYINQASALSSKKIYLGGHSKGGNLAIYAAVKCREDVKKRIDTVFCNDGPGFSRKFLDAADYKETKPKIKSFIPQSSVVGLLLEHDENYEVIKSSERGLMQHNPLSWEVLGASFIKLNAITKESRMIDRKFKAWLSEMSAKQREDFVDAVYEVFSSTSAATLTDLGADKFKLIKALGGMSDENKATVIKSIKLLLKDSSKKKKS